MIFTEAVYHRSEKSYKVQNKSTHCAEDKKMNGKAEAGKDLHSHYSALRLSLKGKHRDEKRDYSEALCNNLTCIPRFYRAGNFKHNSSNIYLHVNIIIIKQKTMVVKIFYDCFSALIKKYLNRKIIVMTNKNLTFLIFGN